MAILERLSNLDIDGGITYLANEPLGDVKTVPLYRESYTLLTSADGVMGQRDRVGWSDLGELPLCLMTPDMQNRRIIDQMLRDGGASPDTALQSNSLITLIAHVATGRWSSIVPSTLTPTIGLPRGIRAIPIGGSRSDPPRRARGAPALRDQPVDERPGTRSRAPCRST